MTIDGSYRDGMIALSELPVSITAARALVTFLPGTIEEADNLSASREMSFGMYPGDGISRDEDFASAEWRGEKARDLG